MPSDSRRNAGPENTLQYQLYLKQKKTYEECEKELCDVNNRRKDGRKLTDSRKIYVKTGVVSQAKGSAYIEMKNTKVICSVFDPREIPNKSEFSVNGELYCEFKFATFSCKKRRHFVRDVEEKELSVSLKRALEPAVCRHEFPNFQVDVYVLVLENDGSALAAAITCAGLALADASVPMYDLISASTMGVHGERRLMDPTVEEENVCLTVTPRDSSSQGVVTLAYLSSLKQVTELCQSGLMEVEELQKVAEVLEKQATEVYLVVQQCLAASVKKHFKDRPASANQ
ncbi:exosome complex component MTR3-like [Macrosteles quadrilineatus]|uniref:exosome complex component MTR3-like n=1 Tax=Macrosteles quadrilineatus TaxID=74068 RepID=UPI0023E0969E|nr:exosome complex component MTR3-like [Macrosteles quadrilineatus]XP_054275933.1 exosome complex component MTR3-like [Macrosteles quadrilineatus]